MKDTEVAFTFFADLTDSLDFLAKEHLAVDEKTSKDFSEKVALFLAEYWGGQSIYVPVNMVSRITARNKQLFKEFTGSNQSELARKYKLSTQHVYNIIKEERKKNK